MGGSALVMIGSSFIQNQDARSREKKAAEVTKQQNKIAAVRNEEVKQAAKVDQAMSASKATRERRAQVSSSLVAQRQIEAEQATSGFGGTAATSAMDSVSNQASSNIAEINRVQAFGDVQTGIQENIFDLDLEFGRLGNMKQKYMNPSSASRMAGSIFSMAGAFAGGGKKG
jgi:hypothetical protein